MAVCDGEVLPGSCKRVTPVGDSRYLGVEVLVGGRPCLNFGGQDEWFSMIDSMTPCGGMGVGGLLDGGHALLAAAYAFEAVLVTE